MRITKEQISNYVDYFNELKYKYENSRSFKVKELQEKYGVTWQVNTVAKSLGLIDYSGHGRGLKYKFKYSVFEPIQARRVIETARNYSNKHHKKWLDKVYSNKESINKGIVKDKKITIAYEDDYSLRKYKKFFHTIEIMIDNNADFSVNDLIKKCGVSKNTMTFAYSTGLLKKDGNGKYAFNKELNNENILSIIKTISHYQNQSRDNKEKQTKKETVKKIERKQYTGMETHYYIFGIRIMKSVTRFTLPK